jgi:hypothetical protein
MAEAMIKARLEKKDNKQFNKYKRNNRHHNSRDSYTIAQLDLIANTVRVIKREIHQINDEMPNNNVRFRRETARMSTSLPTGYRSGVQAIMDDLREIQEALASLQIGISRMELEATRARAPIMPYYQPY